MFDGLSVSVLRPLPYNLFLLPFSSSSPLVLLFRSPPISSCTTLAQNILPCRFPARHKNRETIPQLCASATDLHPCCEGNVQDETAHDLLFLRKGNSKRGETKQTCPKLGHGTLQRPLFTVTGPAGVCCAGSNMQGYRLPGQGSVHAASKRPPVFVIAWWW